MGRKRPGDGHHAVDEVKKAIEKRLFLGRLPSGVSEDELRRVFGEFGEITECRIVDKGPGKTMAFVGFTTWASAHNALKATDGKVALEDHTQGQTIVASFAERSSSAGRGGGAYYAKGLSDARIFVGGMPEDMTENGLRDIFERFGTIEGLSLLAVKTNKRCGFVNFSLWGEALDAIEAMDNAPVPGSLAQEDVMTVVFADPKPEHSGPDRDSYEGSSGKRRRLDEYGNAEPSSKLAEFERIKAQYLAAAEGHASEEACTDLHWRLMSLRSAWSAPAGGRSGGGGGSSWAQPTRGGSTGSAQWPTSSRGHSGYGSGDPRVDADAARLFIGGLPYEVTTEELQLLIEQLRLRGSPSETELLECRILPGKGCGYVRFASWHAAEEAMEALDDRTVNGWKLPLRAKWAVPKPGTGGGGGSSGEWGGGSYRGSSYESSNGGSRGGSHSGGYTLERSSAAPREREARSRRSSGGSGEVDRQRLFIGQLQRQARKEDVVAIFEPYGQVEDIKYLEDKGIAYVTYVKEDDAKYACEDLNGKAISGISRGEGLNVQFAKPR